MLLMELKTQEKFAFLHISHHLAMSDGKIGAREEIKIEDYCTEMGIDNIVLQDKNYNLDECLNRFKSQKSQKILLLELMMLIHIDDVFNQAEHNLIKKISEKFNISDTQVKYASSWGKAASALREQALLMVDSSQHNQISKPTHKEIS